MSEQTTPPPAEAPAAASAPTAEAPKKSIVRKLLPIVFVLVLAGGYYAYNYLTGDPGLKAEVGKCLADVPTATGTDQQDADDAKVVECTEAGAKYKIIGKIDDKMPSEADAACQAAAPDFEYVYTQQESRRSSKVMVLCLTDK